MRTEDVISFFQIYGAVVFADIEEVEKDGEKAWKIGEMNDEYFAATIQNGMLWATKDGKEFSLAIAVKTKSGKALTIKDFLPFTKRR